MAKKRMPIECYEDGPKAKKAWDERELEKVSTPSREAIAIAWEQEREEEEAAKARKRQHYQRLRFAQDVLSHTQYRVFQLKLAGLKDNEIAQILGISIPAVRTYRYEFTKKLREAKDTENLAKGRRKGKKRRPNKKIQ